MPVFRFLLDLVFRPPADHAVRPANIALYTTGPTSLEDAPAERRASGL